MSFSLGCGLPQDIMITIMLDCVTSFTKSEWMTKIIINCDWIWELLCQVLSVTKHFFMHELSLNHELWAYYCFLLQGWQALQEVWLLRIRFSYILLKKAQAYHHPWRPSRPKYRCSRWRRPHQRATTTAGQLKIWTRQWRCSTKNCVRQEGQLFISETFFWSQPQTIRPSELYNERSTFHNISTVRESISFYWGLRPSEALNKLKGNMKIFQQLITGPEQIKCTTYYFKITKNEQKKPCMCPII